MTPEVEIDYDVRLLKQKARATNHLLDLDEATDRLGIACRLIPGARVDPPIQPRAVKADHAVPPNKLGV